MVTRVRRKGGDSTLDKGADCGARGFRGPDTEDDVVLLFLTVRVSCLNWMVDVILYFT